MPSSESTVGPLDEPTVRPARFLALARVGSMLAVIVLLVATVIALGPRIAAGWGLVQRTSATVTAASTSGGDGDGNPATGEGSNTGEDSGSDHGSGSGQGSGSGHESGTHPGPGVGSDRDCGDLTVEGGDGTSGTLTWCAPRGDALPEVGDTVAVWALPGWDPVRAETLAVWSPVAIIVILLLLGSGWATGRFAAETLALERIRRGPLPTRPVPVQITRMVIGRGVFQREGRVVVWARWSTDDRLLRMVVPGAADRSLLGVRGWIYPLRGGRDDRPLGPYLLRRPAREGRPASHRLMLGRAVRSRDARSRHARSRTTR